MKIFIFLIPFIISTNIYAYSSLDFLNSIITNNNNKLDKNFERLSGGVKLLEDDPANYAIYDKLEAEIREIKKRASNDSDMISYYTYMDAVLSGLNEYLQRIRELLIQKSSPILSDTDREIIDGEIRQYYRQIEYNLKQAEFNKVKIFSDLLKSEEYKNYFDNAKYYDFQNVDNMLNFFIRQRSLIGTTTNKMAYHMQGESVRQTNSISFKSQGDTNYASEISALEKHSLLLFVNLLML